MNLALLSQVREFQPSLTVNLDPLITALLPRASEQIRRWLSRTVPKEIFVNQRLDGTGNAWLMLPSYPVVELTRVNIDPVGPDIVASDGIQAGYLLSEQIGQVVLHGGEVFPAGKLNVICSWTSGYRTEQAAVVPTGNSPTIVPSTGGHAAENDRVVYTANSTVLAAVSANPGVGQYTFNTVTGDYLFNSGDANQSVTMRYYYVPPPIAQACIELILLRVKSRDNIGVASRSVGPESTSYLDSDMSKAVRLMLQPYRRVHPV